MRFEIFDGARSVGIVAWERPGRVRIEVRDPADLPALVDHFGGDGRGAAGQDSAAFAREGWEPGDFEQAAIALRSPSRLVVPRPDPAAEKQGGMGGRPGR